MPPELGPSSLEESRGLYKRKAHSHGEVMRNKGVRILSSSSVLFQKQSQAGVSSRVVGSNVLCIVLEPSFGNAEREELQGVVFKESEESAVKVSTSWRM